MSRLLFYVVVAVLIFLYLGYVAFFAVNLPFVDDNDLIWSVHEMIYVNQSWQEQWQEFFRVHNDHILVIPRFVAVMNYFLAGSINFRALIFLNNAALLGLLLYFYSSFRKLNLSDWAFLPLLFFYLTPFIYDLTFWSITGIEHLVLNIVVFEAIHILTDSKKDTIWTLLAALAFATLATFTNGNGILTFGVGIVLLWIQGRYRHLAYWTVGMLAVLGLYLWHYERGQTGAGLGYSLTNVAASFLVLLGSWAKVFQVSGRSWGEWTMLFVGLLSGIYLVVQTWCRLPFSRKSVSEWPLFWLGIWLFSLGTIFLIAVARGGSGVADVLSSRFDLYSLHTLALVYLTLLFFYQKQQKTIVALGMTLSLLFCFLAYQRFTPPLDNRRRELLADDYNWKNHHKLLAHVRSERFDDVRIPAYERGVFGSPTSPYSDIEAEFSQPIDSTIIFTKLNLKVTQDSLKVGKDAFPQIIFDNTDFPFNTENQAVGAFLILKAENNKAYVLPTFSIDAGKKGLLKGQLYKNGFQSSIMNENLPAGRYRVGLAYAENGKNKLRYFKNEVLVMPQVVRLFN